MNVKPSKGFSGGSAASLWLRSLCRYSLCFAQIMSRDGFIVIALVAGLSYGATLTATAASKVDLSILS